jgi:nitroreductase
MDGSFSEERGAAIAEVISERRSVRSFTDELPARAALEEILAAGLTAPYAAAMAPGGSLDRRLFVF